MTDKLLPLLELLHNYQGPMYEHHTGYTGEMARRLRKLDERHQPVRFQSGQMSAYCRCGELAPCHERLILDGGSGD